MIFSGEELENMRLPGFTAENSLDRPAESYYTAGAVRPVEDGLRPALLRGCMGRCLAEQGDDPFAYENCRCICYGHPGRTCWLI
jgi:hypothetical protein